MTGQPLFLTLDHVLQAHRSLIEMYGGDAGLRDANLLQSALAMPMASYGGEYLHVGMCEMAAAYLFHIVQNHPFIDGNKRTGSACAVIFLLMNGFEVEGDEDGLVDITLRVATGKAGKPDITGFFRLITHPI